MRIKNDTIIKYYQLPNTMFLTNEEFGILIRKIMMEDDKNGMRYETCDEQAKEILEDFEQQWKYDYQEAVKKNPMVMAANSTLRGQVKKSTKSFYDMQERLERKEKDGMIVEYKDGKATAGKQAIAELKKYNMTIEKIQGYHVNGKYDVREILEELGEIEE